MDRLADILVEFAAADVDRLDLSRRSLDQVGRRDYGLIVVDTRPGDPVACVNELTRRLAAPRRRDCSVVVCHDPEPVSPAIEHFLRGTRAIDVTRPIDPDGFVEAVRRASDGELVPAAS
ncbi:MAG: hypothetical protein KY392_01420 [Chloroflexi bacterium]|nr:hypothetical protein [Chloroflexota bacterium]